MLGAALGQEILGFVVQVAGWRTGMALCGWFGVLIFFMIVFFIRNSPEGHQKDEVSSPRPSLSGIAKMMFSSRLLSIGLVGGMVYSAGLAFAMLWGVAFFQEHLGLNLAQGSFCASLYSWGIIFGLPAFGWACGDD
jgi:sugar phosphate permease